MRRPLVVGAIVSAVLWYAFIQLAGVFESAPAVLAFDAVVGGTIHAMRSPWLTPLMRGVTFLGDTFAVTAATLTLMAVLWMRGHRRRAWYVGVIGAVGAWLSTVFKEFYVRARPPVEGALVSLPASFSFPSGHTMASLCLGWGIAYVTVRSRCSRNVKAVAVVAATGYALSVAFSRVYLGVHWPSDLVASWLLGGAWIALATGVYEWGRLTGRAGNEA